MAYHKGSWGLPPDHDVTHAFELASDDGLVSFDGENATVRKLTIKGSEDARLVARNGYERELAAFVERLPAGAPRQ